MTQFYLDGSQTGSILQGLDGASQGSYIPSISGTQPQQYTPGYGTAPYADPSQGTGQMWTNADLQAAIASGKYAGAAQAAQALTDAYNKGNTNYTSMYAPAPSMASSPTSGGSGGITTIGGSDPWLSPEQMRSELNSLPNISSGSSSGGGGGSAGMGSAAGGAGSGGLNLGSITPAAQNSSPSGITSGLFPSAGNTGYVPPTGSVQYGGLGNPQGGALPPGVLGMQQANPQNAMDAYRNTPGYQMLGNDQSNQYQQSPGYQYAVNEALNQVQGQASARGLLESGSALRGMTDRAVGMAQQDYGNWWNRQNQLYSDYQNRLAGLAGGSTGSANAMTLGQNLAQGSTQMGSNLGSLFANQGSAGMGGIINTGAAQSANMTNAGNQQAIVNQANQSTQLAGATLSQNKGLF